MQKRSKSRVKKVRAAKKNASAVKRLKLRSHAGKRPAKKQAQPAKVTARARKLPAPKVVAAKTPAPKLDAKAAAKLRQAMDRAIRDTHGDALQRAFRASLRMPASLPKRLWSRLRRGKGPVDAEKLDGELRRAEKSGLLASGIAGVGKGYARSLANAFDEAWTTS